MAESHDFQTLHYGMTFIGRTVSISRNGGTDAWYTRLPQPPPSCMLLLTLSPGSYRHREVEVKEPSYLLYGRDVHS